MPTNLANYHGKMMDMFYAGQIKALDMEITMSLVLTKVTTRKGNVYHRLYRSDTGELGYFGKSAIEVFKQLSRSW